MLTPIVHDCPLSYRLFRYGRTKPHIPHRVPLCPILRICATKPDISGHITHFRRIPFICRKRSVWGQVNPIRTFRHVCRDFGERCIHCAIVNEPSHIGQCWRKYRISARNGHCGLCLKKGALYRPSVPCSFLSSRAGGWGLSLPPRSASSLVPPAPRSQIVDHCWHIKVLSDTKYYISEHMGTDGGTMYKSDMPGVSVNVVIIDDKRTYNNYIMIKSIKRTFWVSASLSKALI